MIQKNLLRHSDDALSISQSSFENLTIYGSRDSKEFVTRGKFLENTTLDVDDIQGCLVTTTKLSATTPKKPN